jgi:hypothetical protein
VAATSSLIIASSKRRVSQLLPSARLEYKQVVFPR